jgi:integrase
VGIALLSALVALLIYDYLTPREKVSTLLMAGAPMTIPAFAINRPSQLSVGEGPKMLGAEHVGLLHAAPTLPREIRDAEIRALLAAADPDTRLAAMILLSGPNADEACALAWNDLDLESGVLQIGGTNARALTVSTPLRALLSSTRERRMPASDMAVIRLSSSEPAERRRLLDTALACAAHDAMVPEAETVTGDALWHSYLAFLVRQGIRFADLGRVVGALPNQLITAYMELAPSGVRLTLEQVQLTMPALYEQGQRTLPSDQA